MTLARVHKYKPIGIDSDLKHFSMKQHNCLQCAITQRNVDIVLSLL